MATLLRRFAGEFELDYSTLFIEDDAVDRDIVPPETDGWLHATEQQVSLSSASGVWNAPEALLEYWDGEPPPAADWATASEALTWFSTGRLCLWRTIREYPLARFDLGGPGFYRVRAHTGDRDRIRQDAEAARSRRVDEGAATGPLRGAERFLIQFWPAPPSDTRDQIDAPGRRYPEGSEQQQFADAIQALASHDPRDP
ncbi:hypothetical protein [Amycolatopsis circi]|uniref:hypothetical protein n=1 Tax=Amycolatopsis circi TaxID=871959 RepID=UPI000E2772D1|nr:hypothetical protein [Amycolatopsis circi]